jgi:hypothetical protein
MDITKCFIILISVITIFYAIAKERQELGCYRTSIDRQCIDENSVYVKNTRTEENDTCEDMIERLNSIVSYHEKGGIWKRCIIIALIINIFIFVVSNICKKDKNIFYYNLTLIVIVWCIIYFYHNYINYHHFRLLKRNGIEIIDKIKNKCFLK